MTPAAANGAEPDAKIKPEKEAAQVKFAAATAMDGDATNDDGSSFGQQNPSISDPTTELTEEDIFRMKSMSIDRNGWKNGLEKFA